MKTTLRICLCLLSVALVSACQTTEQALNEAAKKHAPGNPAFGWVNGTWKGTSSRFERAYWMRVVDGNKIIGKEESCRRDNGACSGRVPLWGTISDDGVLDVTYDKTAVPGVGRIFRQTLVRSGDNRLSGPGFMLKRVD